MRPIRVTMCRPVSSPDRTKLSRLIGLLLPLLVLVSGAAWAQAPYNHPELKWMTIESEHAIVHYPVECERTAREVAAIADQIYAPVTQLYHYEPDAKIHWIIKDTDDYANGGSFYYDQKIEVWATPLDFELRGTHHWLYNVVTHEFTHMIQLGASRKYPRWLPGVYFQVIEYEEEKRPDVLYGYPNQIISYPVAGTVIPMWFAEGTAQFQAPGLGHDYWDSHRDMILRTRSLGGKMLTWNQLGVFGKTTLGSESVYNSGYALVRYISKNWGADALERLSKSMAKPWNLTFDRAVNEALGISGDELHDRWVKDLSAEYMSRTELIRTHPLSGKIINNGGFANLYPSFSPDGKKIVFMSDEGEDYMSLSSFYQYDVDSARLTKTDLPAKGAVSWSPDGRYIVYARQKGPNSHGSSFNDLYIYDWKTEREIRLTEDARLSQPSFSPDGKRIVAVLNRAGTTNLALLDVPDDLEHYQGVTHNWFWWGRETGTLAVPGDAPENGGGASGGTGKAVKLPHRTLTSFDDGEQLFLPRWSPDGNEIYVAYANLAQRDIYRYSLADSSWTPFIATPFDDRDLVFTPDGKTIYYASDRTGIFNIYRRTVGSDSEEAVTNVTGGAFLPEISPDGKLVYDEYTVDGYQVALMDTIRTVEPAVMQYMQPEERETSDLIPAPRSSSNAHLYKSPFESLFILPRITWDYGQFKPGFYAYTNDFLEKISLFGAGAINLRGDRDLYGSIEYHMLKPTLFLEGYNLVRYRQEHFEDNFVIVGKNYVPKPNGDSLAVPVFDNYAVDYNFVLNELDVGGRLPLTKDIYASAIFRYGNYQSKLHFDDGSSFDYTYYTGEQYLLRVDADSRKPSVGMDIQPKGGWRGWAEYGYETNNFITGFEVLAGKGTISEVYAPYHYHRLETDVEYFYPLLSGNLVVNPHIIGGVISDDHVDPFFHLYAGGLVGLRGYSFYSLGGTRKAVGRLTLRFPIAKNIDWQMGPFYLDRIHLGLFGESGDAWRGGFDQAKLKNDVGADLRVKLFSWYGYPTDIQFTMAYGLDKFSIVDDQKGVHTYGRDWRWYLTVLFDFI